MRHSKTPVRPAQGMRPSFHVHPEGAFCCPAAAASRLAFADDVITLHVASQQFDPATVGQILRLRRHYQDDGCPPEPYWPTEDFAELLALVALEDATGGEEP